MESVATGTRASAAQVQPFLNGMHAAYMAGSTFAFAGAVASLLRGPQRAPVEAEPATVAAVADGQPSRRR